MYENLRKLRIEHGLSQSEMAEKLDLPPNTYNNYELQTRHPKSDFWVSVAETFHVSIDYLMGFCDDPHSTKYAVNFQTSHEEKNLVRSWRSADDRAKEDVAHALRDFGFNYVQPQKEEEKKEAI